MSLQSHPRSQSQELTNPHTKSRAKQKCKLVLKLIILGDSGVGKTSIIHQYLHKSFIHTHKTTIGADLSCTEYLTSNNNLVSLQIWDTAGLERFNSLCPSFYRGADAVILVYDICNYESFLNIERKWKQRFLSLIQPPNKNEFPFLIFGNKYDITGISNNSSEYSNMEQKNEQKDEHKNENEQKQNYIETESHSSSDISHSPSIESEMRAVVDNYHLKSRHVLYSDLNDYHLRCANKNQLIFECSARSAYNIKIGIENIIELIVKQTIADFIDVGNGDMSMSVGNVGHATSLSLSMRDELQFNDVVKNYSELLQIDEKSNVKIVDDGEVVQNNSLQININNIQHNVDNDIKHTSCYCQLL